MIATILLIWIGAQISAPVWYFVVCGVLITMQVVKFIVNLITKSITK